MKLSFFPVTYQKILVIVIPFWHFGNQEILKGLNIDQLGAFYQTFQNMLALSLSQDLTRRS
jgi:hypothetical protein